MPGGDGTGPWGAGGRWICRRGFGSGFGRGFGRGFGLGYQNFAQARSPAAPVSSEDEAGGLRAYANELEAELGQVRKRIAELGKD